jgi:hypothetical protein
MSTCSPKWLGDLKFASSQRHAAQPERPLMLSRQLGLPHLALVVDWKGGLPDLHRVGPLGVHDEGVRHRVRVALAAAVAPRRRRDEHARHAGRRLPPRQVHLGTHTRPLAKHIDMRRKRAQCPQACSARTSSSATAASCTCGHTEQRGHMVNLRLWVHGRHGQVARCVSTTASRQHSTSDRREIAMMFLFVWPWRWMALAGTICCSQGPV